ncbi:MAG: dTDP-glucose 4,6-dehydratase [Sphaerobacter sp.]|nr:dTDP-glucose 4,6-dehydratase [Sphaerobacter sp.]
MGHSVQHVLVTGGAGFIGSNFVRYLLRRGVPRVTAYDKLTYAGNRASLADVEDHPGFRFIHADICERADVAAALRGCDAVVNFAAETHVDRSLLDADDFLRTNVVGTHVLLEQARRLGVRRFVHVSTDEVYGDVPEGYSRETDPLRPRSPYSASKAAGEMMVLAAVASYGVPAVITRGSNTYGPYQYPEKFIPLMITNALEGRPLPVYGDGRQMRDWIHVEDHCAGIEVALLRGVPGEAYNIGGGHPRENLSVVREILQILGLSEDLIQHVSDRPGHDRRYALATDKLRALGWRPTIDFPRGLRETVEWYRRRRDWWEPLRDAAFAEYYGRNYGGRAVLKGPEHG